MMMEEFARFYVDYIEPGARVLLFFVIVCVVIAGVNFVRNPQNAADLARKTTQLAYKGAVGAVKFVIGIVLGVWNLINRMFRLTFAILRDFFTSQI